MILNSLIVGFIKKFILILRSELKHVLWNTKTNMSSNNIKFYLQKANPEEKKTRLNLTKL